jgi:hypothetical protein
VRRATEMVERSLFAEPDIKGARTA